MQRNPVEEDDVLFSDLLIYPIETTEKQCDNLSKLLNNITKVVLPKNKWKTTNLYYLDPPSHPPSIEGQAIGEPKQTPVSMLKIPAKDRILRVEIMKHLKDHKIPCEKNKNQKTGDLFIVIRDPKKSNLRQCPTMPKLPSREVKQEVKMEQSQYVYVDKRKQKKRKKQAKLMKQKVMPQTHLEEKMQALLNKDVRIQVPVHFDTSNMKLPIFSIFGKNKIVDQQYSEVICQGSPVLFSQTRQQYPVDTNGFLFQDETEILVCGSSNKKLGSAT